ncbi:MAG TPA: TspO/MBR family protein [Acidimicrobiales bacterium]
MLTPTVDHHHRTRPAELGRVLPSLPALSADVLGLIGFLALAAIPLVLCLTIAGPQHSSWYEGLDKPALAPPLWVVRSAWLALAAAVACGAWLVWRTRGLEDERHRALVVFGWHLLAGLLWAAVFFGGHAVDLGLLAAAFAWLTSLAVVCTFGPVHRGAAVLNVPSLLWATYVAGINAAILVS